MWPMSMHQQYDSCIETQVSCTELYLKYTSNWMLKFIKEILQFYKYSIHSKDWLQAEETSASAIT